MFPRFTLRTILIATTLSAVFFLMVGAGYRGQLWAWGAVIGVLSIALTALVQAALYGVVWCFARLSGANAGPGRDQEAKS